MARRAGLQVIRDYWGEPQDLERAQAGADLNSLLDGTDVSENTAFKHFAPPFSDAQPDLAYASLVNATFVFQKVSAPPPTAAAAGPSQPGKRDAPAAEEAAGGRGDEAGDGQVPS